jgi:hypothetical protein
MNGDRRKFSSPTLRGEVKKQPSSALSLYRDRLTVTLPLRFAQGFGSE